MSDEDALLIWKIIMNRFSENAWENIESTEPDPIDQELLKEILQNSNFLEDISSSKLKSELGLQ